LVSYKSSDPCAQTQLISLHPAIELQLIFLLISMWILPKASLIFNLGSVWQALKHYISVKAQKSPGRRITSTVLKVFGRSQTPALYLSGYF
jgi:hypothetical protein